MLTIAGCRDRQQRLRASLAQQGIDAALITDSRDVYYLTGVLPSSFPTVLYLTTSGDSLLIDHTGEGEAAVGDRHIYEYNTLYTLNPDPLACLASVLSERVRGRAHVRRLGWQAESLPRLIGDLVAAAVHPDDWVAIDTLLSTQQQRKDPDEIAILRKVNACNLAAYAAAEAAIKAGEQELAVLAAAQRAAMLEAGEVVSVGGDYRSGAFGGPARLRMIEAGELYIIDSGLSYHGYWTDLARTFPVTEPTALQRSVYAHVAGVLSEVATQLTPGASGTAVWWWMDRRLREHPHLATTGLITHGGHGIGTRVHEMPDINRDRDGILAAGNVVTCEPGGYSDELRAGIRLENAFLITDTGVENLSPYPLNLGGAL